MLEQQRWAFGAVGDVALSGPTSEMMRRHGTDWPFERIRPLLQRAGVLFGNLECVLVPDDFPDELVNVRGLVARGDVTESLQGAGFDVLSLANNHVLDAGTTGLFHTARAVGEAGILAGGVGRTQQEARRPVLLDREGLRWGFLCYAEDSNYALSTEGPCYAYYSADTVLEDIARLRPAVDVLVVSVHADLEFLETPSPERRAAFRQFARAGATLVLGHHPHVPQGVERIGSSLIAYSLGNFVFHPHTSRYMRGHRPGTAQSFVLLADVSGAGVHAFARVPVLIGAPPEERPTLAQGDQEARLRSYFERLDAMVHDDELIARNWRSTAIARLQASARSIAHAADDPERLLHTVGRLLYVAENRAWVDEVERAASEAWQAQRQVPQEFQRPSFATESTRPRRRTLRSRVRGKLRRKLGAFVRREGDV